MSMAAGRLMHVKLLVKQHVRGWHAPAAQTTHLQVRLMMAHTAASRTRSSGSLQAEVTHIHRFSQGLTNTGRQTGRQAAAPACQPAAQSRARPPELLHQQLRPARLHDCCLVRRSAASHIDHHVHCMLFQLQANNQATGAEGASKGTAGRRSRGSEDVALRGRMFKHAEQQADGACSTLPCMQQPLTAIQPLLALTAVCPALRCRASRTAASRAFEDQCSTAWMSD